MKRVHITVKVSDTPPDMNMMPMPRRSVRSAETTQVVDIDPKDFDRAMIAVNEALQDAWKATGEVVDG